MEIDIKVGGRGRRGWSETTAANSTEHEHRLNQQKHQHNEFPECNDVIKRWPSCKIISPNTIKHKTFFSLPSLSFTASLLLMQCSLKIFSADDDESWKFKFQFESSESPRNELYVRIFRLPPSELIFIGAILRTQNLHTFLMNTRRRLGAMTRLQFTQSLWHEITSGGVSRILLRRANLH